MWTLSQAPPVIGPETMACVFRVQMDGPSYRAGHEHPVLHQLTWAPDSVLTASFGDELWTVPTGVALWIPAGHVHEVHGTFDEPECLEMKVHTRFATARRNAPALVAVTPLIASLLRHLADPQLDLAERRRAELVLLDRIRPSPLPRIEVPMPADARVRRIAHALLADPADDRRLDDWARFASTSGRTLDRLIRTATGAGFTAWRIRIRMAAALAHIARGTSVAGAGRKVGYRNASAFTTAFRRELGCSPTEFGSRLLHAHGATDPSDGAPLMAFTP